jgi:hypothetical protein
MRLLLGSLVNTIPASHTNVDGFVTAAIPPLTITPSGAEIDYSLLLFADQLVFDEESLNFLLDHSDSALNAIGRSADTLRREGLLETINFRSLAIKYENRIELAAQRATENPEYWITGIRDHIRKYEGVRPGLARLIPNYMSAWDEQIFPIANYFAKQDRPVSRIAAKRLTNLILTKEPAQMTSRQLDAVQLVIAETVRVVSAQALVAEDSTSRHYSWNTCDHIFDMLATFRPTTSEPIAPNLKGCRDFFRLAYPEFAPTTQAKWLEILLHKDVGALRKKIADASNAGFPIDAEFARKEFVRLISTLGETGRKKMFVGRGIDGLGIAAGAAAAFATSGMSLLPSLLVGAGLSGVGIAAKESSDLLINMKANVDFRWMYFISSNPLR